MHLKQRNYAKFVFCNKLFVFYYLSSIYKVYSYLLSLKLNIIKKIIFVENIKDIRNLKQSDLKLNDWIVKLFK